MITADNQKKARRTFRWTHAAREAVKANIEATGARRRALISQLVRESGNPRDACLRFARKLGLKNKRAYRKWSARDHRDLLTLIERHPVRIVALKFGCGTGAVYGMLRRLGATATMRQDSVTLSGLAQLLHLRPQRVKEWIDAGLLEAHREGTEKLPRLVIQFEDFARFCKQNREVLLKSRVTGDRLEFIFRFVFPPSHTDLLPVREAKKKRTAYENQAADSSEITDQSDYDSEEYEGL